MQRVHLLGCPIDAVTMAEAVARASAIVERGAFAHCAGVNAAKLVEAVDDPRQRAILEEAELVTADGQSVVWALRLLGRPLPERVAGIDLMHRLFGLAEERGWGVFLLGARGDVLEEAVRRLRQRHPRLVIAGHRNGYFTPDEEPEIAGAIAASGAQLLFVGITSPRKEQFIDAWGPSMGVPFVMGVGGSFDVVSGLRLRAPRFVQRLGLEWLFRLAQEPRRLLRRYAVTNARFVFHVFAEASRRRRGIA